MTGTTPATWAPTYPGLTPLPSPSYPDNPALTLRLEALASLIYVAFGAVPDPTVEPRRLVHPGLVIEARIRSSDQVAAVAASDIPA